MGPPVGSVPICGPCPQPSGNLTSSTWEGFPGIHHLPWMACEVGLFRRERGARVLSFQWWWWSGGCRWRGGLSLPWLQDPEGWAHSSIKALLIFQNPRCSAFMVVCKKGNGASSSRKPSFQDPIYLLPVTAHKLCPMCPLP